MSRTSSLPLLDRNALADIASPASDPILVSLSLVAAFYLADYDTLSLLSSPSHMDPKIAHV
jgi:hypothetical protein